MGINAAFLGLKLFRNKKLQKGKKKSHQVTDNVLIPMEISTKAYCAYKP